MFWRLVVKSLLIWLCLINLQANNVENITRCFDPNSDYKTGKKLNVFYFKLVNNVGPYSCFKECLMHGNCLSVNYNRKLFVCQLLSQKPTEQVLLQDDKDFIYMEIPDITDPKEKKCSGVSCNYYSTCIRTLHNSVCIATECAENLPTVKNGKVTSRVYSPHSAVYGCLPRYFALGSVNTIYCLPGGKWGSLSYQCMTPIHGGYSAWGSWTACTKTCDTGTQTRSRKCNNPSPKYGGNGCKGNSTEIRNCKEQDCNVDIVGVVLDVID